MLNQSFTTFDQFTLLSTKELETKKAELEAKKKEIDEKRGKSESKIGSVFTFDLSNVMLDLNRTSNDEASQCLVAKEDIKEKTIVFSEPIIAASWALIGKDRCSECDREMAWDGLPCTKCPQASFCSDRCFAAADPNDFNEFRKHDNTDSVNCKVSCLHSFATQLQHRSSRMVYDLLVRSGARKLQEICNAITKMADKKLQIKQLKDVMAEKPNSLSLLLVAMLISNRANELNALQDEDLELQSEVLHLLALLKCIYKEVPTNLPEVLYKLLQFFKISGFTTSNSNGDKKVQSAPVRCCLQVYYKIIFFTFK